MSKHRETMQAMVALSEQHWDGVAGRNVLHDLSITLGRKLFEVEAMAAYKGFLQGACAMVCFTVDKTPAMIAALAWMTDDLKHRAEVSQTGGGPHLELDAALGLLRELQAGRITCYEVTDPKQPPKTKTGDFVMNKMDLAGQIFGRLTEPIQKERRKSQ